MPPKRRAVYFAFQGLLMAVILLLFLFQGPGHVGWVSRLFLLLTFLAGSMTLIRLVPDAMLARGWFQAGLFLGDALLATVILSWIQPRPELFLIYTLIVFGSALTRSARQSLAVAFVTIALYFIHWWRPDAWIPHSPVFWLRFLFLVVSAALLALLARDSQAALDEDKRRYDERLIQVERLATLGRVAAEVAHRIKGPLTTIAVNAEVAAHRHGGDKETLKELAQITEEVQRCKEILKNLLDLGRIEEMDSEALDVRVPLERALTLIKPQAAERGLQLEPSGLERPMKMRGDESLIQEALYALLQNAVEAAGRGGRIRVTAETSGGRHRVSVSDDGAGVARGDLEKIFQPFFTTKKEGSGLGLSAALRIAQKHGGTVEVDSAGAGLGAKFTLVLPASR
ncbi:MAG: ATP-binding protein [Elusimicrobia bacterium]|nr:ATP-binding protein [Elusimicrobiota bacterium]